MFQFAAFLKFKRKATRFTKKIMVVSTAKKRQFWFETCLKKNIVPLVSDFFFLKLRENCQTLLFSNICIMFVVWMDFCSPESQFSLQYFFVFLLLTKYPKTLYPVPLQKFLLFLSMGIENLLFPAQTFQQEWFQCNFFLPISDGDKIIG